ncbi:hypothetical protein MAPG_09165 [Magnaporthiopsis poae ATCC 64411]|uniref:Uncharacterized protein n=1 Tax=Magnaporthiopsis poae (strain ATCC 64411 / 73-15) TaxID=644358 RepID=A0A0C4E986_MAGP6|nr:hypothetical protein MAPG_09165 [Magnaporthiopsis poae ATCC 64411]
MDQTKEFPRPEKAGKSPFWTHPGSTSSGLIGQRRAERVAKCHDDDAWVERATAARTPGGPHSTPSAPSKHRAAALRQESRTWTDFNTPGESPAPGEGPHGVAGGDSRIVISTRIGVRCSPGRVPAPGFPATPSKGHGAPQRERPGWTSARGEADTGKAASRAHWRRWTTISTAKGCLRLPCTPMHAGRTRGELDDPLRASRKGNAPMAVPSGWHYGHIHAPTHPSSASRHSDTAGSTHLSRQEAFEMETAEGAPGGNKKNGMKASRHTYPHPGPQTVPTPASEHRRLHIKKDVLVVKSWHRRSPQHDGVFEVRQWRMGKTQTLGWLDGIKELLGDFGA